MLNSPNVSDLFIYFFTETNYIFPVFEKSGGTGEYISYCLVYIIYIFQYFLFYFIHSDHHIEALRNKEL